MLKYLKTGNYCRF